MPRVPPAAMAPAAIERAYPGSAFGERHSGHRGGGGDRGSRYRAKAGASANGGVDQSAFEVTEYIICQPI
ncbi:MAG: hypothetical protein CM15mP84_00600 [Cellvibrionales bacterium]|nr:MAG: hypothetical protein CM15mP84_00600 [Cellvibrionales bacterium]